MEPHAICACQASSALTRSCTAANVRSAWKVAVSSSASLATISLCRCFSSRRTCSRLSCRTNAAMPAATASPVRLPLTVTRAGMMTQALWGRQGPGHSLQAPLRHPSCARCDAGTLKTCLVGGQPAPPSRPHMVATVKQLLQCGSRPLVQRTRACCDTPPLHKNPPRRRPCCPLRCTRRAPPPAPSSSCAAAGAARCRSGPRLTPWQSGRRPCAAPRRHRSLAGTPAVSAGGKEGEMGAGGGGARGAHTRGRGEGTRKGLTCGVEREAARGGVCIHCSPAFPCDAASHPPGA